MELLFFLSVWAALAYIPAHIASSNGRDFWLWFLYGFFFWLIALIHSLFLKPNGNADGYKECKHCLSAVPAKATACKFCGKDV